MNRRAVFALASLVATAGLFAAFADDADSQAAAKAEVERGGVGARVFVVERETSSLAVYDFHQRELLPGRIGKLGNLRHATMVFTPDLRHGFLATRSGKISRIDLQTLEKTSEVYGSKNSIDNAISQDGRFLAVGEYDPGGLTVLDSRTLKIIHRLPGTFEAEGKQLLSRVTGVVDAPGNRFVCVLMEGSEIWIVKPSAEGVEIEAKIKTPHPKPYDAMITPDGRYYLVGHLGSEHVSMIDLRDLKAGVKSVSLRDPSQVYDEKTPVKLPHMASWAVAGQQVFVPLVGQSRLAVLEAGTFAFKRSIPLRGHPVYAVCSPTGAEVWVSFSGEKDDAFVQVIDTETCQVKRSLEVGKRIYHMDFTPRGSHVLITANQANQLVLVNANTYQIEDRQDLRSPSGVFGVWRAFKIGL